MEEANGFSCRESGGKDPHPLLKGGRPNYANTIFSSRRHMEVLKAICDTIVPSLDPPAENAQNEDVRRFYSTSASQAGVPDYVAGYVSKRLVHPMLRLLTLALWLLSTWWGTFFLCGFASLCETFPFFRRFQDIPQPERERIMLSWSTSWIPHLRMMFRSAKMLTCLAYYSMVDAKGTNPSWKAIGYSGAPSAESIGYDPPLRPHVIDVTDVSRQKVMDALRYAGFHVTDDWNTRFHRLCFACWNQIHPDPADADDRSLPVIIKCDVVVVGSGSGGGVAAGELAKAGLKVIVLDKGRYFAGSDLSLLEGPSLEQMYDAGGLLTSEDGSLMLLAGSAVGGGSAINWSASLRTPPHVLREWSGKMRLPLFSSAEYPAAMDEVCARMSVGADEGHPEGLTNAVLRRGAEAVGYAVERVPRNSRGGAPHMCGWCCFGCRAGTKQGTHETWLVDAARAGAVVLASCEALSVVTEPGKKRRRAVGVVARGVVGGGGRRVRVEVEARATVVACGALRTPALLLRSGLRNRHIGRHLHVHPTRMAWGVFEADDEESALSSAAAFEGGIITSMVREQASGATLQTPSLHPGMFAVAQPWTSAADMRRRMARFRRTCHIFALARDESDGSVDARGYIRYRVRTQRDRRALGGGVEAALRVLVGAGASHVGTHHISGEELHVRGASQDEVDHFLRRAGARDLAEGHTPMFSAHQMGSCRMGASPATSAVDPTGEAWEVEHLFLADGSVLPTALGVNPMVTIQALALCTARSLLRKLGVSSSSHEHHLSMTARCGNGAENERERK